MMFGEMETTEMRNGKGSIYINDIKAMNNQ